MRGMFEERREDNLIIDILNILVLIEWAALGIAVYIKAKGLHIRAQRMLDSLDDDVEEVDGAATN